MINTVVTFNNSLKLILKTFAKYFFMEIITLTIQTVIKPARRAPVLCARALAKFTPIHHWEGVNSNLAEIATFGGNAYQAVFARRWSKTTNLAFKDNALTNKSPFDYFWVRQHFWAIPGV